MTGTDDQPTIELLHALADAADGETLPRFRQSGVVDDKGEGLFDPVTEADRAAERAIRQALERERPGDAIYGEEYGVSGTSRRQWVIDPIDGTRAFISGVPVWGTLIGFTLDGTATAGVMSQPFTGERFLAAGGEAFAERGGERRRIQTRRTTGLEDASLFTTDPHLMSGDASTAFARLRGQVRLTRYGLDCYAFCILAAGHGDIVVEAGLKPYDIVALVPIVEAAGGVVTTWDGRRPEGGGDIVAAATPELHEAALRLLRDG